MYMILYADRLSRLIEETFSVYASAVDRVMAGDAQQFQIVPSVSEAVVMDILRRERRSVVYDVPRPFSAAHEASVVTSLAYPVLRFRISARRLSPPFPVIEIAAEILCHSDFPFRFQI